MFFDILIIDGDSADRKRRVEATNSFAKLGYTSKTIVRLYRKGVATINPIIRPITKKPTPFMGSLFPPKKSTTLINSLDV